MFFGRDIFSKFTHDSKADFNICVRESGKYNSLISKHSAKASSPISSNPSLNLI